MDTQNNDYRVWPNVKAIEAKIDEIDQKLDACELEKDRMFLKQKRAELVSKKYDQIQFNKQMLIDQQKVS